MVSSEQTDCAYSSSRTSGVISFKTMHAGLIICSFWCVTVCCVPTYISCSFVFCITPGQKKVQKNIIALSERTTENGTRQFDFWQLLWSLQNKAPCRSQMMDKSDFLSWKHHLYLCCFFFPSSFDGKKIASLVLMNFLKIFKLLDYCALIMWVHPATVFCAAS